MFNQVLPLVRIGRVDVSHIHFCGLHFGWKADEGISFTGGRGWRNPYSLDVIEVIDVLCN